MNDKNLISYFCLNCERIFTKHSRICPKCGSRNNLRTCAKYVDNCKPIGGTRCSEYAAKVDGMLIEKIPSIKKSTSVLVKTLHPNNLTLLILPSTLSHIDTEGISCCKISIASSIDAMSRLYANVPDAISDLEVGKTYQLCFRDRRGGFETKVEGRLVAHKIEKQVFRIAFDNIV